MLEDVGRYIKIKMDEKEVKLKSPTSNNSNLAMRWSTEPIKEQNKRKFLSEKPLLTSGNLFMNRLLISLYVLFAFI